MKKKINIEQAFCDVCGKEASGFNCCDICGKDFCYDCRDKYSIQYKHAVNFSGSGDGFYCLECDKKALESGDKKHSLYRAIKALRNEEAGWYEDFRKRQKKVEEELERMNK